MNEDGGSESVSALERLERQNDKLRTELKELTLALENAKNKQKHAKVPLLSELSEDKSTATVHSKISKLKQEITRMKKELEGNLNIGKITDLENRSTFLSKRIQELESEQLSLKKIEKEQQKALNSANQNNTYPEKISKLKEDIRNAKDKYRELVAKQKQDEKIHNAQHEKCVDLDEKCRRLYEQIKKKKTEEEESRRKRVDGDDIPEKEITEEDIQRLESKIKEAESTKNEEEMQARKRIKDLETQVREGKHHLEMLKIKVKEKDQECRLSLLKIKELRKAMKHNQLKPLQREYPNSNQKARAYSPASNKEENSIEEEKGVEEEIKKEAIEEIPAKKGRYVEERYMEKDYANKAEIGIQDEPKKNSERKIEDLDSLINNKDFTREVKVERRAEEEPIKPSPEFKKKDLTKPNFNF